VSRLTPSTSDRLLVGPATGDDAAVWRVDDHRALVFTADFITPVVDDATTWGRIAATNSVSDIYAMGGRPLMALNLVGWNTDELSTELLGKVLAGGQQAALEAGMVIAGGHTIDDPEPKYGLAVIGEVDPDHMLTNTGLRAGQSIILTKPLGLGIATTAIKRGLAPTSLELEAIEIMTRLNDDAALIAVDSGATGATDVTGFGLLGHLGRMAIESGVSVRINTASVPILTGARELAADGVVPGGSRRNLDHVADHLVVEGPDELTVLLLADAQTSGGLVFGVPGEMADDAIAALEQTGHSAAVIGNSTEGEGIITLV